MTKLLLIAAAGLDWAGFDASTRSGALPKLAALQKRGFAGSVTGAPTGEGLAAFASLATGVQPETHGLWRGLEAWGGGLRPTGRASWRASPLWARLEAAGVPTGSVGWPGVQPGADWAGAHIDETFADPTGKTAADWALPLRCAPGEFRDAIAMRRVHPTQITTDTMLGFVPELKTIDQSHPTPLPALALAIARAATYQAGAVWMLTERAPDAVFVHYGLLGQVRGASEGRPEPAYAHATRAAWRFLDGLIGRLADLAGRDALVLMVSPGWRGHAGVVLAAGPGTRAAPNFLGADLLDIAPTVLAAFGLEVRNLTGRVLEPLPPKGRCAPAPAPPPAEFVRPDEDLLRIAAENGCPPPPPPRPAWRAQGLAELGQMLLKRAPEGAEKATADALKLDPNNALALRIRATALFALERSEGLLDMADGLERTSPTRGWSALARGAYHVLQKEPMLAAKWLKQAEADPEPDTRLTVGAGWLLIRRPLDAERVFKSVLEADPACAPAEIGMAIVAMARRDFLEAEAALQRAVTQDPGRAAIYETMGQLYRETGRKARAEQMTTIARRLAASGR
jgi:Type I phosphodiesterase / nucleotide pyrophosphatase